MSKKKKRTKDEAIEEELQALQSDMPDSPDISEDLSIAQSCETVADFIANLENAKSTIEDVLSQLEDAIAKAEDLKQLQEDGDDE